VSLDLYFTENSKKTPFFQQLACSGGSLERLSLNFRKGLSPNLQKGLDGIISRRKLRKLKDLSLRGSNLSTCYGNLVNLFDFASLSRLTVYGCIGTTEFFKDVGNGARQGVLSLTHLAMSIWVPDAVGTLNLCRALTILHLSWEDERVNDKLLEPLAKIGSALRTLSLDGPPPHYEEEFAYPDFWSDVLSYCRNLRQLGWRMSHNVMVPSSWRDFSVLLVCSLMDCVDSEYKRVITTDWYRTASYTPPNCVWFTSASEAIWYWI
jgi:hypothetical protein